MEKEYILHLMKNKQLVGIMTPEVHGMDHIIYPSSTSVETRNDILKILNTLPNTTTIQQRIEAIMKIYTGEGYVVEKAD